MRLRMLEASVAFLRAHNPPDQGPRCLTGGIGAPA